MPYRGLTAMRPIRAERRMREELSRTGRSTMAFTDPYGRYELPCWTSVFTASGMRSAHFPPGASRLAA